MDYFKKRQKTRRWLYSKVSAVGLLIILAFMVKPTWEIFQKSRESKANLEQARAEMIELEARQKALARDYAYIQGEPGKDQKIRDKFGVAREDETMVVIIRDDEEKPLSEPTEEPSAWDKIKSGFESAFGLE